MPSSPAERCAEVEPSGSAENRGGWATGPARHGAAPQALVGCIVWRPVARGSRRWRRGEGREGRDSSPPGREPSTLASPFVDDGVIAGEVKE